MITITASRRSTPRHPRPILLALALLAPSFLWAQSPASPRTFEQEAVVCQSRHAAEVGARILQLGGNAVDAAVATAFAMSVTYPEAGNIGGGGFLVLYVPATAAHAEVVTSFDFRERAPARAHATMFLKPDGTHDADLHHRSHLAVGVPGSVAGLGLAHSRHGRLPWKEVVLPAVTLARNGFDISAALADSLARVIDDFRPAHQAKASFTRDGQPLRPGEKLVQSDLADTLERIATEGAREFYEGTTARLLVEEMARGGGWITRADLADYRAVERRPVVGTYRGHTVISMPPPSSGGIALVEMLNILEGYDLARSGPGSASTIHLMAEAMRRAFADRARFLADPDHVEVPLVKLTSKSHAAALRHTISRARASTSSPDRFEWPPVSNETTHISVVDRNGMAVALTTTLEQAYGAKIVVPGAGFLLNNEMGDFNAGPGLTNDRGLIGTAPNLAGPGKRMVSSMTPTIVLQGVASKNQPSSSSRRLLAVIGSPGGRTIINSVLGIIIGITDHRRNIQEAVNAPRVHHQWLPDRLLIERGFSPDTVSLLRGMGHTVTTRPGPQGSVMAITRNATSGRLEIGLDQRRPGGWSAGR